MKMKFSKILLDKFSISSRQKTRIKPFSSPPLSLEMTAITLQFTISSYFSKIDKNLVKNAENLKKKQINDF